MYAQRVISRKSFCKFCRQLIETSGVNAPDTCGRYKCLSQYLGIAKV